LTPRDDEIYEKREQTQVKHYILSHYLERFAHIVGSRWSSITYVDGFAGPWNVRSPDLADSSFAIALAELRKARVTHQQRGRSLRLRCFFLEKENAPFVQLREVASQVTDAEVEIRNDLLERSVSTILEFIRRDPETFSFIFLDPTGWTGLSMEEISPLLRHQPGEVLVNFMTSHIRRFPSDEQAQKSLTALFGNDSFRQRIAGLSGIDLDDELVSCYREALQKAGNFPYVLSSIVLHPEIDRPIST
jgi:three-Cys-motif partner protein